MTYLLIQRSNDALHHLTRDLVAVNNVAVSLQRIDFELAKAKIGSWKNVARSHVTCQWRQIQIPSIRSANSVAMSTLSKDGAFEYKVEHPMFSFFDVLTARFCQSCQMFTRNSLFMKLKDAAEEI